MTGWIELFRSLGEALLEVFRAELEALQQDFSRSGRHLGIALALLGAAAVLLFWTVGLLLFTLVLVLDIWLPLWAAALILLGLFALVTGILGALGARRIRQVENPVDNVKRRMDDHIDWWQHSLLAEPRPVGAATASPSGSAGAGYAGAGLEEDDLT
ncbi:MAG TPA: phage holin family protein [Thermoanaerobaculia bacterium]|nr:phage holin family protein [Thermoanaerobaculia bacterium]